MQRLFVTVSILFIAGIAYGAARAPAGPGVNALSITDASLREAPRTVIGGPAGGPSPNPFMRTEGVAKVAAADVTPPPQSDPVPQQSAATAQSSGLQPDIDAVLRATARVDLNTATVAELDSIPGAGRIGRSIVRHRPYRSVEDLLAKRVLRQSVYDRIKDEVAAQ